MKHTSLNIIRYGSITRHYSKCSRCLRRSAAHGCTLGRYLWKRYYLAASFEKHIFLHQPIYSVYKEFYNV